MNFQNLNFDHVEPPPNHPQLPRYYNFPRTPSNHSQVTVLPYDSARHTSGPTGGHTDHASSRPASPSPRPTVVPYAPTPPSKSTSDTEIYGPDRLFGPPLLQAVPQAVQAYRDHEPRIAMADAPDPLPPFYDVHKQVEWKMSEMAEDSIGLDFKDQLARAASNVTPGVDDAPYLQFALDALTRPTQRYSAYPSTSSEDEDSNTVYRHVPDQGLGYYQPPAQRQRVHLTQPSPVHHPDGRDAPVEREGSEPWAPEPQPPQPQPQEPEPYGDGLLSATAPLRTYRPLANWDQRLNPHPWDERTPASSQTSIPPPPLKFSVLRKPVMPHEWEAFDIDGVTYKTSLKMADGYGNLHFKPRLLKSASLGALMILCLLMIAALIFCAVFSQLRRGLVPFDSMYGGLFFVFRVLPQLLASVILMYAQCTITVLYRFLPFVRMHSSVREERYAVIFQDLYPKSFLWPQRVGPWQIAFAITATWLANMTLPLQSSAFTVILVDGNWRWAAVQGVVWVLVALYLVLLVSIGVMLRYLSGVTKTGLLWDARSLADIATMVSSTNVASDYKGTDKLGSRSRLTWTLRRRVYDRLGYWGWRDARDGFWYAIGITMTNEQDLPREIPNVEASKEAAHEHEHDQERESHVAFKVEAMDPQAERDLEASVHAPAVRYRYLPWCLRNNQMIYFAVTTLVLFAAILVVSFLPSTRIVDGFLPLVEAGPDQGAFSPANFLYSFLPSFLGLLMFLLFRSLDQDLRILQPWAALADRKGATAKESLLADYAACLPLESSLHAARNGHWRLACVSLLSTLFVLLPALGGGLFMALTTARGEVRMFPNVPLFGVVLSLLFLYLVALLLLLPGRSAFRLPHGVTCLAEIISFLANEDLLADPAFKRVRSVLELQGKLGIGRDPRDRPRWVFGVGGDGAGESLGVRRMRKFTERRIAQRRARRIGGSLRAGRRASDLMLSGETK